MHSRTQMSKKIYEFVPQFLAMDHMWVFQGG